MAGRPGQPLTIHAAIEVVGERDPDAVYVNFYASADTLIGKSDYYLGQISVGLSMNSWTVVTLHCQLPENIPPGTYYVGWIIDPDNINDETNELNNVAFNDSSLLTVARTPGSVLYVDLDARGSGDGSSWENAFHALQDALAAAVGGYEIRMADGVYTPDRGALVKRGDRQATFKLKNGLVIVGGYAGAGASNPDARDTAIWRTILSGDLNGDDRPIADRYALWLEPSRLDNSLHVVTAIDIDRTTVLDGIRITGGHADGRFDAMATPEDSRGAGMYVVRGGPRLRRCVFSENWASREGGAMYAADGHVEMFDCTLWSNSAGSDAQDYRGAGGAIFIAGGDVALISCTLNGNQASGSGGAIAADSGGALSGVNCCLHANHAGVQAGAIHAVDCRVVLVNCTLADNRQDIGPGAIVAESSDGRTGDELRILNCIVWNGGREIASTRDLLVTVACSDIWGGWEGVGNIAVAPLFVDPAGPDGLVGSEDDDLRLGPGSPCIDAGDTAVLPRDSADMDDDGDTAEPLPHDRDGRSRIVGASVDMGAYETPTTDARDSP
ncbi:MAG TPA: choice-of-anchor Q domain-containing protein [Sedimentisphaerales bacterium]|nr:choice-of-anchor Q domain-containing protein [Sedimentisphaerales bacterium]